MPSFDIISEPVFLDIDPKTPYERAYPASLAKIADRFDAVAFPELIDRLITNSNGNVDRLLRVHEYLFRFLGGSLKQGVVFQMIEHTIKEATAYLEKSGIRLDIHNGCIDGGKYLGPMGSV